MSYQQALKFVTLEEIFGGQYEMNYVIFNPVLSKEQNEHILRSITERVFHITLTDDEVDALTVFTRHELNDFITLYRSTLKQYWNKK